MLELPVAPVNARALVRFVSAWLGAKYATPQAVQLLTAIGAQESGYGQRRQFGGGPGRGFWQFSPFTVALVASNAVTREQAVALRNAVGYATANNDGIYAALTSEDLIGAGYARLLLWADPAPLPDDAAHGWEYYLRVWRPGVPRHDAWPSSWGFATKGIAS